MPLIPWLDPESADAPSGVHLCPLCGAFLRLVQHHADESACREFWRPALEHKRELERVFAWDRDE